MLLPFIFPSTVKRTRTGIKKPSKVETTEFFITHSSDISAADSGIRKFYKKCNGSKITIQLFITFIGLPVSICWVNVGHIKYIFKEPLEAVTVCMAIFSGLNIRYPKDSEKIWQFVQTNLFKISTPYDREDLNMRC